MIILHCAPTLAGMKTANLFNYKFTTEKDLQKELVFANQELNIKGVYIEILHIKDNKALLYVYRKWKLCLDLMNPTSSAILQENGYLSTDVKKAIEQLKKRIAMSQVFPHEIGLFLGYPVEDVQGFIEQKGKNFKYSGLWKVYHNENDTIKLFAKFKKCSEVYARVFANGRTLTQLTVVA